MSIAPRSLAEARALLLSPLGPVARAGQDLSRPRVSFEFFPPKSDEAEASLWKAVTRLAPLAPEFVSVTYGAGGSTRERTHRTVQRILAETTLTPAAHLTCVEASREEVDAVIEGYREANSPTRGQQELSMPGLLEELKKKVNRPIAELPLADETVGKAIYVKAAQNPAAAVPVTGTVMAPVGHAKALTSTFQNQGDAPSCPICGHIAVRNGA